jgi:hypothetical protein
MWIRWIRIRIRNTDEKGKKTRGDKQGKVVSVIRSLFLKNNWISGSAAARPLVSHSPIRPYEKGKKPVLGIRIWNRIRMFLGLPDWDPFVRGADPDPAPNPSLFS